MRCGGGEGRGRRLRLIHAGHTVHLIAPVPAGGCPVQEELCHERRHAELNRRTLPDAAAELRAWGPQVEMVRRTLAPPSKSFGGTSGGRWSLTLERLRPRRRKKAE